MHRGFSAAAVLAAAVCGAAVVQGEDVYARRVTQRMRPPPPPPQQQQQQQQQLAQLVAQGRAVAPLPLILTTVDVDYFPVLLNFAANLLRAGATAPLEAQGRRTSS